MVQGDAHYGRSMEGVAGCEDVAAFARVDEDFGEVILGDNLHLPLDPESGSPSAPLAYGSSFGGMLAVRDRRLPPPLGYLAIATALSHWLIVLGDELEVWPLANLAFGGRIVLRSVFLISVGRHVLRCPALGG